MQFNLDGADMDERERKALMFALEQQKKKKYLEGAGVMFYTDECTVKLRGSLLFRIMTDTDNFLNMGLGLWR